VIRNPIGIVLASAILTGTVCVTPAAAADPSKLAVGAEIQLYPSGVIPGLHGQWALSTKNVLTFRLGYNLAERQDNGEHDDEEGGGPGATVGYRRYFRPDQRRWYVGGRVDLWTMEIDWQDDTGGPAQSSGTTDILVLQPTVEAGYGFQLGGSRWRLDAGLAFGFEINVHTDGEEVGEGASLLGGATVVYNF
jgi:hypothetical protein